MVPENISKGGKSELLRAGWSLTATGGDPKESATENKPPSSSFPLPLCGGRALWGEGGKGEKGR